MRPSDFRGKRPQAHPRVEQLEPRHLPSGLQASAAEQLFLEALNDARANPAAYGAAIGVDLSGVAPAPPLAFNAELMQAAQSHAQDMNERAYFDHTTPEGLDPGARITQAGFFWTGWGESLAGGSAFPKPADALRALIIDQGVLDVGHRRQLLAIDSKFQKQNQVGIGIVQSGSGPLRNYYVIDTAAAPNGGPFLTGVVFNDKNGDGRYAASEGLAGVSITVAGVGATMTFDSGGYTLSVSPGTYTVTARGGGLPAPHTRTVIVGNENVRLNYSAGDDGTINKLYQAVLGRSASTTEITAWLPTLDDLGVTALAAALERSKEACTRRVDEWYVRYLGRHAGNGEEFGWVNALSHGATEEDVQASILSSPEFLARALLLTRGGSAEEAYVQALYALLLGRAPVSAEVNGWISKISTAGWQSVAAAFLGALEYRNDAVKGYYSGLLQRKNAPLETEVAAWAAADMDLEAIRIAMESSTEFLLQGS
jgi:uncharacterized protein YkwD